MRLTIITPAERSVSVQQAKNFMRVDHNDDDWLIQELIKAVDDWLAGPHGWLGRAICPATFKLTIPNFPAHPFAGIRLPRPPLIEVQSIAYVDEAGAPQTLGNIWSTATGDDGIDCVFLKSGESWPRIDPDTEVSVVYRAGYATMTPNDTDQLVEFPSPPEGLKRAIFMAVARLYASSHTVGLQIHTDEFMARLFAPYRVFC